MENQEKVGTVSWNPFHWIHDPLPDVEEKLSNLYPRILTYEGGLFIRGLGGLYEQFMTAFPEYATLVDEYTTYIFSYTNQYYSEKYHLVLDHIPLPPFVVYPANLRGFVLSMSHSKSFAQAYIQRYEAILRTCTYEQLVEHCSKYVYPEWLLCPAPSGLNVDRNVRARWAELPWKNRGMIRSFYGVSDKELERDSEFIKITEKEYV